MRHVVGAAGLLALLVPAPATAQDLVPDRPGFADSTDSVLPGVAQIESGLTYGHDHLGDVGGSSVTLPELLLRVGVAPRTEIRLGFTGLESISEGPVRASGASDLEVGLKVHLPRAAGFDLAVLPLASLPTGSDGFSSERLDAAIHLAWARDLTTDLGLSGAFNLTWLANGPERFVQRAVSLSIGRTLVSGWEGFAEAYAVGPLPDEGTDVTIDAGLANRIGTRLQLDIEAGWGLTSAAGDWFIGGGIAIGRSFRRTPP